MVSSLVGIFILLLILSYCQLTHGKDYKINGHLVISSYINPLAKVKGPTFGGGIMEQELVDILSKTLNFTFEVVPPPDFPSLGTTNGTGSGGMRQLMRQEIDVLVTLAEMTIDKLPYADATYPVTFDLLELMIPYPKVDRKSAAMTAMFPSTVWICLVVSMAVSIGLLNILVRCLRQRDELFLLSFVDLVASQGGYFQYRQLPFRLIWGSWSLVMIILTNVYTRKMISNFTAPEYVYVANSVEDVAKNERIMPYLFGGNTMTEQFIRESPLSTYKAIGSRFEIHPKLKLPMTADVIAILTSGDHNVFISSYVMIHPLIVADARKKKTCRFTLARNVLHTRLLGMLVKKNSPILEPFSRQLMLIHQAGLLQRQERRFIPDVRTCLVPSRRIQKKAATLGLFQLQECFILWGFGVLLSLLTFVASILLNKKYLLCGTF